MNGVLLLDKPGGMTSHDVVAWARRRLHVRAVGHAGTLDPMATGLLVLLVGTATRLSSLLTGKDKTYEAEIRLGFATDTDDREGTPIEPAADGLPANRQIEEALGSFLGTLRQRPPAHSAKKVAGRPAYEAARRRQSVDLSPVEVTVRSLGWAGRLGDRLSIRLTVSAGFYVRALARDLGERLGCGAHLSALRRTASGAFRAEDAITLAAAEAPGVSLEDRLIAPADAIPDLPAARVDEAGLARVRHGNGIPSAMVIGPAEWPSAVPNQTQLVRILAPDGQLVALGKWRAGTLHPVAVLG